MNVCRYDVILLRIKIVLEINIPEYARPARFDYFSGIHDVLIQLLVFDWSFVIIYAVAAILQDVFSSAV